jgi:hypothetical protein
MHFYPYGKRGAEMSHAAATMPDLLGLVRRAITPDVVRTAASQLGEEKDKTASAVSASVPTVLTALSEVASSDTGATHLKQVFDQSRTRGYCYTHHRYAACAVRSIACFNDAGFVFPCFTRQRANDPFNGFIADTYAQYCGNLRARIKRANNSRFGLFR